MKGQSLVETLVALSVALILLTITTVAITSALSNAQNSKNQGLASDYAQQSLEVVRQMRDASWQNFDTFTGSYCMADTCTQLTNAINVCGRKTVSCGRNMGTFSREVLFERDHASCRNSGSSPAGTRVTVTLSWADSKCMSANDFCRKVNLVSCFTNVQGN